MPTIHVHSWAKAADDGAVFSFFVCSECGHQATGRQTVWLYDNLTDAQLDAIPWMADIPVTVLRVEA